MNADQNMRHVINQLKELAGRVASDKEIHVIGQDRYVHGPFVTGGSPDYGPRPVVVLVQLDFKELLELAESGLRRRVETW